MKGKMIVLLIATVCIFIFADSKPAYACSPAPWTFDKAYESKAMVYGKVASTENNGRAAIVDVISYAGPDSAPKRIHMPDTVDERPNFPEGMCPDFSMKFEAGAEYVFFLSDTPPHLRLQFPSWITASLVEDGQVIVSLPRVEKDSIQDRLQQYAQFKGYTLQLPHNKSPVWDNKKTEYWPMAIIIAVCVIIAFALFYRKRKKRHANNQ